MRIRCGLLLALASSAACGSDPSPDNAAASASTGSGGLLVGTASKVPVDLGASWKVWQLPPFVTSEMFDGVLWLREVGPTTPSR